MSAERVDHAAYAADLLEKQSHWPADRDGNDPESDRVIQEALVRATLALVEQQRIANVIALGSPQKLIGGGEASVPSWDRQYQLRPEIAEALGLS